MPMATRMLRLNAAENHLEIPVRIFSPEAGEGGDWFCRYEIGWPDKTWNSAGWGVDAVQALLLTLEKIGIEIYTSEYHNSGKLMWEAPGRGYGFPVPKNVRDLLVGDDATFM